MKGGLAVAIELARDEDVRGAAAATSRCCSSAARSCRPSTTRSLRSSRAPRSSTKQRSPSCSSRPISRSRPDASATSSPSSRSTARAGMLRGPGSPTALSSVPSRGLVPLFELPPRPAVVDGLEFCEVVSVTRLHAGIADNVIPGEAVATVNLRYPPDREPSDAEAFLAGLVPTARRSRCSSNAPPARVVDSPAVRALQRAGGLEIGREAGVDERRGLHDPRPRRRELRPRTHRICAPPGRARRDRRARHRLRGARPVPRLADRRGCSLMDLAQRIDELWEADELDESAVEEAIAALDRGDVRVAEPSKERLGRQRVDEEGDPPLLPPAQGRAHGGRRAPLPRQDPRQVRLRRPWRSRRAPRCGALRLVPRGRSRV